MGIYISGMEMPETCAACEWSRYAFPNAWCGRTHKTTDIEIAKNGRPDDCPLVPVPPHGRLIDADELPISTAVPLDGKPYQYVHIDNIKGAPTIIPAEEDET